MIQQKMHINQKIIKGIQDTLTEKYSIYNIDQNDWNLFKEPLIFHDEEINREAFEERQEKSTDIIKKILNIHGKSNIVKYLGTLADMEPKIQELQPWVRDHVVHALNTFILGVYILEKVDFPELTNTRFGYQFMWKLCGPTHDLGYPLEIAHNIKVPFINDMNDIFNSLDSPSPRVEQELFPHNLDKLCEKPDANDRIQTRLNDWNLGINVKDYYDWLKTNNKTDHGVVSALVQLKTIDALYYHAKGNMEFRGRFRDDLDFNQNNFDIDIVNACSALFIHNISTDYDGFSNKISFDSAPLAFLLFLCDTFQEYDRYSEERSVYSGNDFNIVCDNNSISLFVPEEIENDVCETLHKRLSGLLVKVNGNTAVKRPAV